MLGDLQTIGAGNYAVADFNGDGLMDVFIADWGRDANPFDGAQNVMLIQKPDGTMANETASRLPQFKDVSGGATHGDYDNDGDVDILVLGGGGEAPASGYLLINNGLGHFVVDRERLPSEIKKFLGCTTLDADKDGNLDLAIGCTGWGTGKDRDSILSNNGLGRFSFTPLATLPPRWDGRLTDGVITQSADFNGDGWPDLIFHIDQWRDGYDIQHVQLMLNNQDGTFRDASGNIIQPEKMGLGGNYNRFADFNNDGWMDLMLSRGKSFLYINKGNGVFEDISSIVLDQRTLENNDYANGVPVDIDNDGDMDFVTARQDNIYIDIYRNRFLYDAGAVPLPLPAAPNLQSPAIGGIVTSMDVLLDWDDVSTAGRYQVQVATQVDFLSPALDKSDITSSFWRAGKLAESTSYYWRVRATNTRGAGPWSSTRSFSTPSAHTISGQITYNGSGLAGVVLEGLPGNPQTDATGHYSARVGNGWSGTVVPAFPGYNFNPTSTDFPAVSADQSTSYTSYQGLPWQERAALIAFYQSLDGDHWTDNSGWKTAPLEADGFAAYGSEGRWDGLKVEANTVTLLDMSGNPLLGSLPAELGDLKNLDFLRLAGDGIEGTLPDSFARLTNLNYLRIGCTRITGSLPNYFGNFRFLSNLDLANTSFSGTFPNEICDLVELRHLYIQDCALRGLIPNSLTNLPLLENDAVISYNALYTSDPGLRTFLNEKDPDWESTQTIAPANLQAMVNGGTVNLTWTPITYSTGTGGYRVFYSTTSGGPYTFYGQTSDKTATGMAVTGLIPGIPYYFVVQTRSNTWFCHAVILDSDYSLEVTATPIAEETVSAPSQPTGASLGLKATSYPFTTGGSTSSLGHTVQYKFDWNDGPTRAGWQKGQQALLMPGLLTAPMMCAPWRAA